MTVATIIGMTSSMRFQYNPEITFLETGIARPGMAD